MPCTCQPLINLDTNAFAGPAKRLPRPKGSSYSHVTARRCVRSWLEMTSSGRASVGFRNEIASIVFDQVYDIDAFSPAEKRFSKRTCIE